jgi:hypothetical protein
MKRWLIIASALCLLSTILVVRVWNGPIFDRAKLATMKAEARVLTRTHPMPASRNWVDVPARDWPPTIAGLHPEHVQVTGWGVNITTKSYFDGGWGYHIPHDGRALPMPRQCYSERAAGVFWHGPC